MIVRALPVLVSLVSILVSPAPAAAERVKCRAAISAASAGFVQARTKILQKCREQVVQRKLVIATIE